MVVISNLMGFAARLWHDGRAQDLIEYALTAGFIAVAASAFFPPAIAPAISSIFGAVTEMLNGAANPNG